MEILDATYYGNSVRLWLVAFLTALAVYLLLRLVIKVIRRQLARLASRTEARIDDSLVYALERTNQVVLALIALYLGSRVLTLPEPIKPWSDALGLMLFLLQIGIWGNALIHRWTQQYRREKIEDAAEEVTMMQAVSFVGRLALFTILFLFALDAVPGVEITTLLASLGIGGIAVALALQNILGDLFASLSISLDRPFVIGDFIHVGEFLGTVEHVGLKTTRLRSLSGEQLIFSNNDLLQSRLRNYTRMEERRIDFSFGVVYQTPQEKLERIPDIVREIIDSRENARFDRAHFKSFGASSLDFEVVYYVLSPVYLDYMDEQHAINLTLFARFAEEGIEFAYPTRTLFLTQSAGVRDAGREDGERAGARSGDREKAR